MDLNGAGLLYGLGAVLALAWLRRATELRWWLLGWVAGLLVLCPWPGATPRPPLLQIPPAQGALLVSFGMGLLLLRAPRQIPLLLSAGVLCAAWSSTLLPLLSTGPALTLPLVLALATAALQLRSVQFCPPALRQDACLLLLALGLVAGLVPDILSGWTSATALQAGDGADEQIRQSLRVPLLLSTVAVVLGLLYTRWRYR
jgi:hypothetical protein